jgi:hypothetical protein
MVPNQPLPSNEPRSAQESASTVSRTTSDETQLEIAFEEFDASLAILPHFLLARFRHSSDSVTIDSGDTASLLEAIHDAWRTVVHKQFPQSISSARLHRLSRQLSTLVHHIDHPWDAPARNPGIDHLVDLICRMAIALAAWSNRPDPYRGMTLSQTATVTAAIGDAVRLWTARIHQLLSFIPANNPHGVPRLSEAEQSFLLSHRFWLNLDRGCAGHSAHCTVIGPFNPQLYRDFLNAVRDVAIAYSAVSCQELIPVYAFVSGLLPPHDQPFTLSADVRRFLDETLTGVIDAVARGVASGTSVTPLRCLFELITSLHLDELHGTGPSCRADLADVMTTLRKHLPGWYQSEQLRPHLDTLFSAFYRAATGRPHYRNNHAPLPPALRHDEKLVAFLSRNADTPAWPPCPGVPCKLVSSEREVRDTPATVCLELAAVHCFCDEQGTKRVRMPGDILCPIDGCDLLLRYADPTRQGQWAFYVATNLRLVDDLDFWSDGDSVMIVLHPSELRRFDCEADFEQRRSGLSVGHGSSTLLLEELPH